MDVVHTWWEKIAVSSPFKADDGTFQVSARWYKVSRTWELGSALILVYFNHNVISLVCFEFNIHILYIMVWINHIIYENGIALVPLPYRLAT